MNPSLGVCKSDTAKGSQEQKVPKRSDVINYRQGRGSKIKERNKGMAVGTQVKAVSRDRRVKNERTRHGHQVGCWDVSFREEESSK